MRWGILCTLAACGRIGFTARGDAIGTGDDDGNGSGAPFDAASLTCTPFVQTLATNGVGGLAWTGDRYIVETPAGLATISADGVLSAFQPLSPPSTQGYASVQSIAWNGSELGVAWISAAGGEFEIVDLAFSVLYARLEYTGTTFQDALVAWAGDRFVAVWLDTMRGQVSLYEFTPLGMQEAGTAYPPTTGAIDVLQSLTVTPTSYLVGVYDGSTPAIVRFARPASAVAAEHLLTLGAGGEFIQLAPIASGAVALQSEPPNPGALQLLDASGTPTSSVLALPTDGGALIGFAAAAPVDAFTRVVGITNASPHQLVVDDFDATTQAFAGLAELDTFTAIATSQPAIVAAPDRIAISFTYSDGMSHLRMIQLCR